MVAVAHGGHAHAVLPGLCDREFHGAMRRHKAQTVAAIQQRGRGRLGNNFDRLGNRINAIFNGLHIAHHVADAVGVHPAQAGRGQNFRRDLGMIIRHVDCL